MHPAECKRNLKAVGAMCAVSVTLFLWKEFQPVFRLPLKSFYMSVFGRLLMILVWV